MKRAACLLLLLSVWLLALPARSLPAVYAQLPTASAGAGKASLAVEHAVQRAPLPQVLPAPLSARVPIAPSTLPRARARWLGRIVARAPDLRAALRRVQTRRRVPRLSAEEPPW